MMQYDRVQWEWWSNGSGLLRKRLGPVCGPFVDGLLEA